MALPKTGAHVAHLASQVIIYETKDGALCAAVQGKLADENYTLKSTQTLVKQDGTVNQRTVDAMRKLFGDPMDSENLIYRYEETPETAVEDIEGAGMIAFEFVIEHKQDTDKESGEPYTYASVQWLNVPGGGVKMPDPVDRKKIVAKYGAKFRALSGGKSVAKTAEAPAKEEKKTGPTPPGKKSADRKAVDEALAPTATMDEAWEAFIGHKSRKGKSEDANAEIWYAKILELFQIESDGAADLSLKQYGALKVALIGE
jgi:hypothetical protein